MISEMISGLNMKKNCSKGWIEFTAIEDAHKLIHETIGDIRLVFHVD